MKVKILFFGATADAAGTRSAELNIRDSTTSSELFAQVLADFPDLNRHKLLYALNEEYATGQELISDGDEVAIFTAVSGG